jgi:hypothetical protein
VEQNFELKNFKIIFVVNAKFYKKMKGIYFYKNYQSAETQYQQG